MRIHMKSVSLLVFIMFFTLLAENIPVVTYKVESDPTISFRILFKVGSAHDPAGKEGLAYLTAQMLSQGSTKKHSYADLIEEFYPMASGFSSQTDKEVTVFYGRTHRDNLEKYYELIKEILFEPAFSEQDFIRIKQETISYLENTLRYASDEELGKHALYYAIFKDTRYAHPIQGFVSSLKSITLEDVKQFYSTHYNQSNLVLGLGGGFDDTFLKRFQKDFTALPVGKESTLPDIKPHKIDGFNVLIVEKPGSQATAISMGYPIHILRGEKEWYPLDVARSWLGEHRNSSSHLYQVIREKRGLNYGDYAYIEHFPNGGRRQFPPVNVVRHHQIFEIWIRPVPNYARHFAMRAALREYKKLLENGLSEEDFELTRKFLHSYILNYAPTTMMKLGYRMDDYLYGINGSHLEIYRTNLEKMTREDVNQAIRNHFQYGKMWIVFVTDDAKSLANDLVRNTPSPIKYSVEKPKEILEEDKAISTFKVPIRKQNIHIVKVENIFE